MEELLSEISDCGLNEAASKVALHALAGKGINIGQLFSEFVFGIPERAEALLCAFSGPKELYSHWKSFLSLCVASGLSPNIILVSSIPNGYVTDFLDACKFNPRPTEIHDILKRLIAHSKFEHAIKFAKFFNRVESLVDNYDLITKLCRKKTNYAIAISLAKDYPHYAREILSKMDFNRDFNDACLLIDVVGISIGEYPELEQVLLRNAA